MNEMIQLATAFTGSLGFALFFRVNRKHLLYASLGGFLAWAVYLLAGNWLAGDTLRYLLASMALTIYTEILTHYKKAPATVFLVPGAIPLFPGGALYDTMCAAVEQQWHTFAAMGKYTLLLATAIALGIICTMSVMQVLEKCFRTVLKEV